MKVLPLLIVAALATAVAASAASVEASLLKSLDENGRADAFICVNPVVSANAAALEARRPELETMSRPDRRQFARDIRVALAEASQAEVLEVLAREGAEFKVESMWIVNCVFVHSATRALVERVARLPSVSFVRGNNVAGRIDPVPRARIGLPRVQLEKALQWNILKIEADVAWNVTRGAGVTVAGIDTGVRYTHESLLASYRGYNGTDVAEHNYNWFDPKEFANDPWWCIPGVCSPWECCAEFPFDNNGHGTHTMGTIAGSEDFGIGVAPGVKWIAAKGCRDGSCLDYGLTRSAQWVICPTDLENDNEDCSVGADIVSNSWGSGGGDIFYHDWTRAWLEAGILPVFSNGNEGPRCETAGSPADHEGVVGVGATDEDDVLADFSSRGPGVGGDGFSVARPNVAAPGVDIYSATSLTGSYDDAKYSEKSGTSMACPHVTGVAALILSVNPQLTVEQLTSILETTADQGMPAPDNGRTGSDECGGVHYTTYPNYHYGQGRVNARKAVEAAMLTLKQ